MKLPIGAGRWLGVPAVAALAATWRVGTVGGEHEQAARASGRGVIYVIWHEALLPLTWVHRTRGDITMLVSATIDGDYLTRFATSIGYRTVRGATGQEGLRALRELGEVLRAGRPAAIALDGPLGPRRVLTPGAVIAAQRNEALLLPLHATTDRGWRFDSWDRFLVPKPWARVTVRYAAPFAVGAGTEGFEQGMTRLSTALAGLTREDGA
ncbi:MAG TPA: lysophospholipid acyltransferase family protein [Gemmatimonadales bacterium]|nr:lysophospholipid acyltransferase family protein [Gemmatimonadales bacterium]